MPEVAITVPDKQVGPMLQNVFFVHEDVTEGERPELEAAGLACLHGQLTDALRPEQVGSEIVVSGDSKLLSAVLHACLVDVGGDVHRLTEHARLSLDEILDATEWTRFLARAIVELEEA